MADGAGIGAETKLRHHLAWVDAVGAQVEVEGGAQLLEGGGLPDRSVVESFEEVGGGFRRLDQQGAGARPWPHMVPLPGCSRVERIATGPAAEGCAGGAGERSAGDVEAKSWADGPPGAPRYDRHPARRRCRPARCRVKSRGRSSVG